MTATRTASALLASAATLLFALPMFSQKPQPRIAAPLAGSGRAMLTGSQPPRAHIASDQGAVDGSTPLSSITMYFSRSAQQQSDLDALVAAQQNPASPQYHQWLTPAQFGARFGLADADIATVQSWLESQGFTVRSVSPSRNSITFSGTASEAASAFDAPLHHYRVDGENHIAPSADLSLPAPLVAVVSDVRGLSDFRPHPHFRKGNGAATRPGFTSSKPNFTSSQSGNHFLTPGDVAVIYDIKSAYSAGFNGAGQTIAIMGQSAVVATDITNFQTAIGQTANAPTMVLQPNTGATQIFSGDESESDLDLEYATGIAPGASIVFLYVGANATASVFDALTYAIQNRIAPILNISYGECETNLGQTQYNTLNAVLQQAVSQGQTVVSAAGDNGSTDCFGTSSNLAAEEALGVDFPSSSQYVTALGGTEFPSTFTTSTNNTYFATSSGSDVVVSALSYIPEQAWNDDSAAFPSSPLSSGGGGVSLFTPAPSWQNTSVPGISTAPANREVPDVSLDASPDDASYAYCSSDSGAWASGQTSSCTAGLRDSNSQDLTIAGGTSFAAPIFSGMVAIINQARGYTYQGLVNPTLYSLASNATTYASAFHDITSGSNACTIGSSFCSTAGAASYSAAVGYDMATGLGSVDLYNLVNAWPASSSAPANPPFFSLGATNVTVTSGSSASSTVTITPANGYTGTVNWSIAPATIPNSCYSITSAKVTGTSSVTATLNIQTGSSTCASGFSPLGRPGSGATAALRKPALPHRNPSAPALAGLGLMASFGLLAFFGRRRNVIPALLAVLLMVGFGLGLSGCGGATAAQATGTGGGTGTGPTSSTVNYSVTVIGTDSTTSTTKAQATFTVALTTTT